MKKSLKKLTLSKETLRSLTTLETAEVLGGNTSTRTSDFRSCGPVSASICPPGSNC
jgi:hypothetical protein